MLEIHRWYNNDCVIGRLKIGEHQFFTLELPNKNNKKSVSCIPDGEYQYKAYDSPSKGKVLLLENVPDRTWIEVHAGNYTSQIQGCVLVGDGIKWLNDDSIPDVTNSKRSLDKVLALAGQNGTIEIT
jgi:hypothetical protein